MLVNTPVMPVIQKLKVIINICWHRCEDHERKVKANFPRFFCDLVCKWKNDLMNVYWNCSAQIVLRFTFNYGKLKLIEIN